VRESAEPAMNRDPRPPDQPVLHVATPADRAGPGGTERGVRGHRFPLLLLLSGPAVLLLVVLDAPAWLRVAPVLAYVVVVPGLAVVRLLRLADTVVEAVLGVGLSLALGVLVAQLMVYAEVWSSALGLAVLVAVASAATALELYRGPLRGRPERADRRHPS
jgi:hypothetical protein